VNSGLRAKNMVFLFGYVAVGATACEPVCHCVLQCHVAVCENPLV